MRRRSRHSLLVLSIVVGYLSIGGVAPGTAHPAAAPAASQSAVHLYRKYCGQCHALKPALAAGFGTLNGLGQNGGPSFDDLRVSANLCVVALTAPFIGHEILVRKLNWAQIQEISRYLARVTRHHPVLAQPVDG